MAGNLKTVDHKSFYFDLQYDNQSDTSNYQLNEVTTVITKDNCSVLFKKF